MVIRAIREHAATHNWFAVGIDLVIVVIGVFLGTQANNWNANRIADNDARTYRARMIEDVSANQADLAARRLYYADVRAHALRALAALESRRADLGEAFLIDAYQASQINQRTFRRSTYDELVSAGAFARLGDQALRDTAEAYYLGLSVLDESNGRLPPYRDRIRREMPYALVYALRRKCGDVTRERHGVVEFSLPVSCHLGLDRGLLDQAVAQVRAAPELDRDLSRYIVDIDQKLSNFEGSQRRAVRFRNVLASANS